MTTDDTVLARTTLPSRARDGLGPSLAALADALRSVAAEADERPDECAGLSIAVPGLVDPSGRQVTRIHQKYADAIDIDLDRWGRDTLGVGVVLDNDARAAAIGEWQHGAGRGSDHLVMITLGTGIGVAAIVDGHVLRGAFGAAGVLGGHLRMRRGGRRCMCGQRGCAEAEASTWALQERAAMLRDGELVGVLGETPLDYRRLSELTGSHPELRAIWRDSLEVWSALIVDLAHAYDPDRIVIGGGISRNADVAAALARALDDDPWAGERRAAIVTSELGDDAALLAASWLVRHAQHLEPVPSAPTSPETS